MSMSSVALLVVVVVAVLHRITRTDPLSDVPGPWLAKYTSLLLAYHTRTGKRYLYVDSLHKRYGAIVRLTPTQVSCASPTAPGIIYAQGSSSLPKTPFYRAFYVAGTPSLFSTQDRAGHAHKRRVLAHPFSYACVKEFEGWMRASLIKFVRGLDMACLPHTSALHEQDTVTSDGIALGAETLGRAGGCTSRGGGYIDVLMWLNYLTFDVISDLAFGEPLGMLDRQSDVLTEPGTSPSTTGNDNGVAAMIDHRGRAAAFLGLFPSLLPPSPISSIATWLLRDIVPDEFVRRGLRGTQALSHIAKRCVKHRLTSGAEGRRGDLLDRLVDGMRSENPDADTDVTEEDIVTEAMLLLTAGSDTTANSTAAILFHIINSPRVLHALRTELHDAMAEDDAAYTPNDGLGDDDATRPVSHDLVKNLKYLQATIDEGLRMFATNAFGLPRVVPPGGSVCIEGRVFGEGTELSAPAYTIQHDPSIWGDPEVFRPERWLDPKAASQLKRHLLTFGMGPRACIGKNLAYMQMQLLIATLVLRYDFQLRTPGVLESVEGFMHKPVDLWVNLRRRRRRRS